MINLKRFILFALIFVIILTPLASCSKAAETKDEKVSDNDTPTNEIADSAEEIPPEYQLNVFDWDKRIFNILVNYNPDSVWGDVDFTSVEESTGDPVNDAVYMRNALIEEMFNVKINIIPGQRDGHINLIRNAVKAGDNSYDITFNTPRENYTLFLEGLLEDLFMIDSIDLDAYFWDSNSAKDLSVMNKLYMATGDISLMPKRSLNTLMFNKKLIADYNYESPYTYLKDDTWTIDKFTQMCRDFENNINTTADMPIVERQFSILTFNDMMPLSLLGGGIEFAGKNSDDIPEITFWSEKTATIFEKIADILFDKNICFNWQIENLNIPQISETKFMANQSMFYWAELRSVEIIRGMEADFGILPVPKYDESQVGYCHTVNPWVAMLMAIPIRSDNELEKVGAVTNAYAKLGHDMLIPAYYEVTLQRKISRDDESEISIDIILDTMRYDQGYMYNWGNIGGFTLNLKPEKLASSYEKIEIAAKKDLQKMIDKLDAIGGN